MKTALLLTFLLASFVVMTTMGQNGYGYGLSWILGHRLEKAAVVGLEERDTGRRGITGDKETIKKLGSSSNIQE